MAPGARIVSLEPVSTFPGKVSSPRQNKCAVSEEPQARAPFAKLRGVVNRVMETDGRRGFLQRPQKRRAIDPHERGVSRRQCHRSGSVPSLRIVM